MNRREKLPNWKNIWYDLIQGEIRKNTTEKGRNLKPNQNLAKGERRKICQKINASIVMNIGTTP